MVGETIRDHRRGVHQVNGEIKILYVSPVGERGGAETTLINILKYHDRQTFEPIVCFLKQGPLVDDVAQLGIRTFFASTSRLRHLSRTCRAIRFIRSIIANERVHLVFGNMAMGHVYAGMAALGTRARAVWFQHAIMERPDAVDLAASVVPTSAILVFSEAARRAQARLSRRRRIVVVPCGIDLASFCPTATPRTALRHELGIATDTPLVACVARLQRGKGQSLFLEAAARVRTRGVQAHFVVVGGSLFGLDPGYAEQLVEEARGPSLAGCVHFLGHRDDVPRVLADVDVLVHCPLKPEAVGLVILEAMAMQVAVVANVSGGSVEIIKHGENGLVVPSGDATALAEAVSDLLRYPSRRAAMGAAGRRTVEERFSAHRMVREIETIFRRVMEHDG